MRAVAEECFALVREYKGSHSGEHGDGLVRSEFHETMFGSRIVRAFETVKDAFDPNNMLNPGRIVRPPRMDDRTLFRYGRAMRRSRDFTPKLDWSDHPGPLGGMLGAVEMCNNNGTCRAFDAGVMCPSYRVTRDETHLTRGRANTLRLALTGQLGADAMASDAVGRRDGTVRLLQGVPARMPDRRRYGEDEDRGAGGARATAWRDVARLADRRNCRGYAPSDRADRAAGQPAQSCPRAAAVWRAQAWASLRRVPCPPGGATRSATAKPTRSRRRSRAARCCCSPTHSIAGSNRRTCVRRCACSPPPAIASVLPDAAAGRCAAAARISRPGMVDKAREEARRTLQAAGRRRCR